MKYKALVSLLFVFVQACSSGPVAPDVQLTAPLELDPIEGKLINQITRMEKVMPRSKSDGFVIPSPAEQGDFKKLVTDLRSDQFAEAKSLAQKYDYEILWYTDKNDENAISFVLREMDPAKRGWGLYVLRVSANTPVIVEAPHPIFDEGTPSFAVEVFRAINARALLVAGAHRDANSDQSADVAHSAATIFQSVHEAEIDLAAKDETVIVLQIHGFASSKHPRYPHVIVSYEKGTTMNPVDMLTGSRLESQLVDALTEQGVTVGTCSSGEYQDLCGVTNVQASQMTTGVFIHIELDETIRDDEKDFIKALESVFLK